MRESTRGYADAVVEDAAVAGRAGALADDVAGVRDVVASSDDLKSVLSDPGIPPHTRRGVVSDLFADHVGADALRLVVHIVDSERAPDIADSLEWAAIRTAAARDGLHAIGLGVLGHHAALERVEGYATAVLEDVRPTDTDDRALGEIEDELFRFARIVAGNDQLAEALTTRALDAAGARPGLVRGLLTGKASEASVRLAAFAATIGRPGDYLVLLDALVARVAAETRRLVAEVRSAVELTEEQQDRLRAALSRIVGQRVDVRTVVDTSVLGGFVATIGDTVIDGSARRRLELLKDRLVTPAGDPGLAAAS
jgi:F-type H+-transporting ATPase subunit delta